MHATAHITCAKSCIDSSTVQLWRGILPASLTASSIFRFLTVLIRNKEEGEYSSQCSTSLHHLSLLWKCFLKPEELLTASIQPGCVFARLKGLWTVLSVVLFVCVFITAHWKTNRGTAWKSLSCRSCCCCVSALIQLSLWEPVKWGHFYKVRTFLLDLTFLTVSNGYLRVKTWFWG